ncbi:DUF349 domain-containing protein [Flavobacterium lindanitolerans]|uniref:DUF349 domain-containing protein n=1 Tax=Flavobacterium lindanitolerans TaxID=428988 RepID=UPI0028074E17|nr:DUF349 domain-containing protein [Flavobacterium lindanitolerans]MDQ7961693.1 DUF349 domain-containing protein [Flavobacterium lindanitolerans]
MLEEKNDNLHEADGSNENEAQNVSQNENSQIEEPTENNADATEVSSDDANDVVSETADAIEISPEELEETVVVNDNQKALDAIADSNAEESEDETLKERHEIPMQDYEAMDMESLVAELEKLVAVEKVMSVKDHVEELRSAFLSKYNHFIEEKREEFLAENPDTTEDFHYHLPLKIKFDTLINQYRDNKNTHFKSLQNNLKANLDVRLAIVEELKELINPQENIKDTLKHFNELRERWKNAGPIPRDKYNHVWNNYHFHVENFYDYLHLDREARDLDFKHNLEQKQRIISRVEELVNEPDVNKAFRELQDLHKIWKEDIGPVSREHREAIWNTFSELTKKIHDKRELLFEKQRGTEQENLEKKKEIISKIAELAKEKVEAHSSWQAQIEKVEALRNEFFATGKVPADVNEETWSAFKNAVRDFNALKNSFYKDIKKDQQENLNKKMALVERAKSLKDSEDFAATTPVMKQIQEEWKQIGHVPRKYSDSIWKEFKEACNHYFDKLHAQRNEVNSEELEAFEKKKAYLETIRDFELTGEHKADLDAIKAHIETWKGFGKVPHARRHIEGKFNKILDALFDKLSLSKKDSEMARFNSRIDQLSSSDDSRKLENEKIFLIRKIEEVQQEIFQLENNIQFFANAKKDNPMVLEVKKNIERHKESLQMWKEKLKQVRNLKTE